MAGLISGVSFSLFSGQPLNLLGSTGPVYVFEKILFEMCEDQNWDYLSLRKGHSIHLSVIYCHCDKTSSIDATVKITEHQYTSI